MTTMFDVDIIRMSETTIYVNRKVITLIDNKWKCQPLEYLNVTEWEAVWNFLLSERELELYIAGREVNAMLDELGIPRFYEN
jgi:hypothetical protein